CARNEPGGNPPQKSAPAPASAPLAPPDPLPWGYPTDVSSWSRASGSAVPAPVAAGTSDPSIPDADPQGTSWRSAEAQPGQPRRPPLSDHPCFPGPAPTHSPETPDHTQDYTDHRTHDPTPGSPTSAVWLASAVPAPRLHRSPATTHRNSPLPP